MYRGSFLCMSLKLIAKYEPQMKSTKAWHTLRSLGQAFCVFPQPFARCTAIFTMCVAVHRPPTFTVTIHKTCTDQQWNGF